MFPPALRTASPHLLLLGGGHAHVEVLRRFALAPEPNWRLTLIARESEAPYSGMLPGLLAGHYTRAECHVDLGALCRRGGVRLIRAAASGLDANAQAVHCADRPPLAYDLLSIDVGSTPAATAIAGAAEHGLPVKPVDGFLERLAAFESVAGDHAGKRHVVVIGGGAGGVELCLALHHRLVRRSSAGGYQFTLISDGATILPNHAAGVRRRLLAALTEAGIRLRLGQAARAVSFAHLTLTDGTSLPCDLAILATGAAAPAWLASSGLALDGQGFLRIDNSLRSVSHPQVFAAGDCAAFDALPLPKSGVYAVRQGPVLAENLRRAGQGVPLRDYRPQRRTLALIATGPRHAIASYGPLALSGAWVWRWKDRIDRRWMAMYRGAEAMGSAPGAMSEMRCGGCAAKLPGGLLGRVMARLPRQQGEGIVLALEAPDDAAAFAVPAGKLLVQSVDQFRSFIDDPYLFGRIAANHCLSDLYAMGATPHSAQALVTLPFAGEAAMEADLEQLLSGALATLAEADCPLIGGHSAEGTELAFGLTVNGLAEAGAVRRKGGLQVGDALLLSKPLGTGVIFAADMRGQAPPEAVAAALASMQQSSRAAGLELSRAGCLALTDVTGFGLAGHLMELLRASPGLRAVLRPQALPLLPGAAALLAAGFASTASPGNEALAAPGLRAKARAEPALAILFDPQTAGGLLAGIPQAAAAHCLAALHRAGYAGAAVIGRVADGPGEPIALE
ncbi:MAG: selenide, water dikinase SelD [Alphaproteobacteria bacterium]|nr:selenide, water dikinase SelD [Alphaproteobacteria bacterium]